MTYTKFGRVLTYVEETPNTTFRELLTTRSRYKWNVLYLHFRNTYGHRIWQGGNLGWEDPTY